MGPLGFGNIGLKGNTPAGPPFVATSAENGLSVDPVTGRIVLGNNVFGVPGLAQLLSNREIAFNTFLLRFLINATSSLSFNGNGSADFINAIISNAATTRGLVMTHNAAFTYTAFRAQNLANNGSVETDLVNDAGRGAFWDVLGTAVAGGDITRLQITGNELRFAVLTAGAIYRWFTGATQRMTILNNGRLRVAGNSTDTTGLIQADGTITGDRLVSPRNLTPVTINANQDRGFHFTNEGASAIIVFNLPAAITNTTTGGFYYNFYVQDADGLQITAAAGDTIRIAGSVTAAAGSVSSTTIGSSIRLHCINATEWVCEGIVGPWTI